MGGRRRGGEGPDPRRASAAHRCPTARGPRWRARAWAVGPVHLSGQPRDPRAGRDLSVRSRAMLRLEGRPERAQGGWTGSKRNTVAWRGSLRGPAGEGRSGAGAEPWAWDAGDLEEHAHRAGEAGAAQEQGPCSQHRVSPGCFPHTLPTGFAGPGSVSDVGTRRCLGGPPARPLMTPSHFCNRLTCSSLPTCYI